jgi:tRNA nucleotidyltransferase (CCA-adding enzyme)
MKTYLVGGSVRDELLGLPVQDRDYVVVGADPAEMARQGFKAVGADFPVFLHPQTHEEYALARTERKTGPGYKGFSFHAAPDVTLEDDLRRRDLTINAMARAQDGTLVDPHGGERDLRAGILRHVSEAFSEDPVRILRVARFAARFGFAVAPETMALMRSMVEAGEADALVAERVWQELARGLMEAEPSRMLAVLRECGALARALPEIDASFAAAGAPERLAARIDRAARQGYVLAVRYALFVLDLDAKSAESLAARVNAPSDCRALAQAAIRDRSLLAAAPSLDAEALLALVERADAFRRPDRLERLLEVAECDALAPTREAFAPGQWLRRAATAARGVDAGRIAAENPGDIPGAVRHARLVAISASLVPNGSGLRRGTE